MTSPAQLQSDYPRRPAYRPPIGIPVPDDHNGVKGTVTSVLLHLLLLLVVLLMGKEPRRILRLEDVPLGAGGINLPGGGGGGTRGTGGMVSSQERITYVQVAPTPTPVPSPVVTPEEVKKPPPTPKIEPPVVKPPELQVPPPVVEAKVLPVPTLGSIDDLVGPVTGGGPGTIYPPQATHTFLLPEPPRSMRPYELVALFDVDVSGTVLAISFNRTGNRSYDKQVEALLRDMKFRPGTDWMGTPVRATGKQIFIYK